MTMQRTLTLPPQAQQLKQASRDLVRAAGGQEAAAEQTGSRQQRMSDVGLRNTADFLRIDEVAALEDITHGITGHPIVTRQLAKRQGYTLLRHPEAPPAGADLIKLVAEGAKENGDVASAILTSLADDGRIDATAQARILAQIDEQIDVAMRLRATVATVDTGGYSS